MSNVNVETPSFMYVHNSILKTKCIKSKCEIGRQTRRYCLGSSFAPFCSLFWCSFAATATGTLINRGNFGNLQLLLLESRTLPSSWQSIVGSQNSMPRTASCCRSYLEGRVLSSRVYFDDETTLEDTKPLSIIRALLKGSLGGPGRVKDLRTKGGWLSNLVPVGILGMRTPHHPLQHLGCNLEPYHSQSKYSFQIVECKVRKPLSIP